MEKKQSLSVQVEVWDICVEENETDCGYGYYSFFFRTRKNGGKWSKKKGYDGSWSGQTRAHFRRVLGRGEAARIALTNEYY